MKTRMTINVGQRGEIVIPKAVREALGIRTGGEVDVILKEGRAEIIVAKDDIMEEWDRISKISKLKLDHFDANKSYDEMMEDQTRAHRF